MDEESMNLLISITEKPLGYEIFESFVKEVRSRPSIGIKEALLYSINEWEK